MHGYKPFNTIHNSYMKNKYLESYLNEMTKNLRKKIT